MKKLNFLLLFLFIMISFNNFSQTKTEWGLKAGLNYTVPHKQTPIPVELKGKIGFYAGGIVSFGISDKVRINPEILFSSQITKFSVKFNSLTIGDPNDPFASNNHKGEMKESLILMPVMIQYLISDHFDVEIGPQAGLLINQKITDNRHNEYETPNSVDFEMGMNLGVGYRFAQNYRIGTRFIYGVVDRDRVKNLGFHLGFQYYF